MEYRIGQIVPHIRPRGITGAPLGKPVWHALVVPPGKEGAARAMLEVHGVHAQYPTREVKHKRRGKQIVRKLPVITQVVYAQFKHAPQWDVLKRRRIITGVYGRGDWPIEIPYGVVRAVMGLPTVAEELARQRAEMARVREGDRATILTGPLEGMVVDIEKVEHGRAWFSSLTGVKGETSTDRLERNI